MNKIAILMLAITNTACTGMLWEKNSYTEYVGGFYIEENSNALVAIGSKFHYIFNVDTNLIEILKSGNSIPYKPTFFSFDVSKDNKISGELTLRVDNKALTSTNVTFLRMHRFNESYNSDLYYSQVIKGDRYAIEKSFENIINFEEAYKINVTVPFSESEYTGKMLLSPVTITTDVILVIPLGVLYGVSFSLDI